MDVMAPATKVEAREDRARDQISANELLTFFNYYKDTISVLSLDCFDTLLWRKPIEPKDVFFDLQRHPIFKSLGITAINRIDAEANARNVKFVRQGHYEVTLHDIYRGGFKSLTEREINELIAAEVDAEIEACYAFPPIVDLIRAANKQGLKIIIVSNTYLQEQQLRRLLAKVLPDDLLQSIAKIFCSCEYQRSKNTGLFEQVVSDLGVNPNTILHIGDNKAADLDTAKSHGLKALQLIQFNKTMTDYLRLQSTAATVADTSIHFNRSMASPFRGVLANSHFCTTKPESLIGYFSIGPIMYTFANYLCEEMEKLKQTGKKPVFLFLMRDAYLPALACEAFADKPIGNRVRISRFSAVAATFRTREDVENYLASAIELQQPKDICKQLLLPEALSNPLLQQVSNAATPINKLIELLQQPEILKVIFHQSQQYWERLKKYLQKEAQISAGDTLVIIDLGYVGRIQRLLSPLLQKELNVEVVGRYLISLNVMEWQKTRSGLIDPSWCDDRTIHALCLGSALLEELCCSADNSVIGYDNDGNAIFSETSTKQGQREKTHLIQQEALRFVREAKQFFQATGSEFPLTMLRDIALAEIARRTFFPLEEEINYLANYQHDGDFGMDQIYLAVDTMENELTQLRRQGLWFKTQNPYGLRAASFELALAHMSQRRHGFATTLEDLSLRRENIMVLLSDGLTIAKKMIAALPTHDGYFSLWFPLDNQQQQIAILFGLNYKAIQIESVDLINKNFFYTEKQRENEKNIRPHCVFNQMREKEGNFFECLSDAGTLLIPLAKMLNEKEQFILRVVFRPIIKRNAKK